MSGALHVIGTHAFLAALRPGNQRMPLLMLGLSTLLAVTPGRIITKDELLDWLYGEDEDGGPEWAEKNIDVAIHRLRCRGLPIVSHGGRKGCRGYSYEPAA